MLNSFRRSACPVIAVALALVMSGSAHATQRFVTPTGVTNGGCESATPCDLKYAVETAAQANDEVIVAGDQGVYTIDTNGIDMSKALNLHGADGQPRPRLVGSGGPVALSVLAPGGAVLRHLQFENHGPPCA